MFYNMFFFLVGWAKGRFFAVEKTNNNLFTL